MLRDAREAAPMMPLPVAVVARRLPQPPVDEHDSVRTTSAPAAERWVDRAELDGLITESGLAARRVEIQRCALTGLRLTPTDSDANSYLAAGASPSRDMPLAGSWHSRLRVLAQVDLSEAPTAASQDAGLPTAGALQLLWALDDSPRGLSTNDAGSVQVFLDAMRATDGRRRPGRKPPGAQYVHVSAELVLPRVWTRRVQEFGLSPEETAAWEKLRVELAGRQGTASLNASDFVALHRVLGYPDERQGLMPTACEAAARGIDLGERFAHDHPRAAELEAASGRWRLLFQLSLDEEFGWNWGPARERLYVWIDEADLRRRDFSRAWAITQ
jgi:uncharacterized protein YwqG